jgi:Undecaprenyl-phosphate galactose phosphotransferase WbaP
VGWIIIRLASGLYPPLGLSQPEELRRSVLTTGGAFLIHLGMLAALNEFQTWRLVGLGIWLLLVPTSYLFRSLARGALIRRGLYGVPCVVIGSGTKAQKVIRELQANPELGFVPVAAFGKDHALWGRKLEDVPVLGPVEAAERYAFPYPVRHAMIALSAKEANTLQIMGVAARLERSFPTIQVFVDLVGIANLWVRPRPAGPYLALEIGYARFLPGQRVIKRIFDLLITVPAFLVAAPVIGVAALLVKAISPGPAFFSQTREGIGGKPIRIWKIRTMVVDAEKRLAEHLASNPEARFEYERTLKLRHDPRVIPRIGRFLRRYSIDELPQLWSVIKGDLSLVGPRVMLGHEVERFSERGRGLRRDVLPGLTGLWQILYRNNSDLQIWEFADSYYVRNWSVWLDLWIILRTFRVVLTGAGAY